MRAGVRQFIRDRQDRLWRLVLGHGAPGPGRRRRLPDLLGPLAPRMAVAFRGRPGGCYTQHGFGAGAKEYFLTTRAAGPFVANSRSRWLNGLQDRVCPSE